MSNINFINNIKNDSSTVMLELLQEAQVQDKEVVVIGCSTSEVVGEKIGTGSSWEVAEAIYQGVQNSVEKYYLEYNNKLFLAFQCCEHLNRTLLISQECQSLYNWERVSVIPAPKAGGSLPAVAYANMDNPIMVEHISAHAGLDIGDTFIGMHLKHVAVPMRPETNFLGEARITMARTRPKLIGGERAVYK